jgi:SpoVK/Ycf46/Vps4 family AAA+-type ATPase
MQNRTVGRYLQRNASEALRRSGAELAALCREAAIAALREDLQHARSVCGRHFGSARAALRPALTRELLQRYQAWGDSRRRAAAK